MADPVVLLIDDDLNVLRGLMRRMREVPYDFRTATSAERALDVLAEGPVDLLVCDWQLPGMSGTEFLARVARSYPSTVRIMLTGHPDLTIAMGAINQGGVFRFLTKPCDADVLTGVIREALNGRQPLKTENAKAGPATNALC